MESDTYEGGLRTWVAFVTAEGSERGIEAQMLSEAFRTGQALERVRSGGASSAADFEHLWEANVQPPSSLATHALNTLNLASSILPPSLRLTASASDCPLAI